MITFRSFIESNGTDVLTSWYAEHDGNRWIKLRAKFLARKLYLEAQPVSNWKDPYFHFLKGKGGLGRIAFDVNRIAYRHLGFFGPGADEFTLLYCAEEHDNEYLPAGCIDEAVVRMNVSRSDLTRVIDATIRKT